MLSKWITVADKQLGNLFLLYGMIPSNRVMKTVTVHHTLLLQFLNADFFLYDYRPA